jgi:hypothetical protein
MLEKIEFYSRAEGPIGEREDWYGLVIPDDGADPFVEHEWCYHDARGAMEISSGSTNVSIPNFMSGRYPEDAKAKLRDLLIAKAPGHPHPQSGG